MVALVDRTNATTPIAAARTRFTALIVSSDSARRGISDTAFASTAHATSSKLTTVTTRWQKLASTDPMTCASLMEPPARANPADDR